MNGDLLIELELQDLHSPSFSFVFSWCSREVSYNTQERKVPLLCGQSHPTLLKQYDRSWRSKWQQLDRNIVLWVEGLPGMQKASDSTPAPHKAGVLKHTCSLSSPKHGVRRIRSSRCTISLRPAWVSHISKNKNRIKKQIPETCCRILLSPFHQL